MNLLIILQQMAVIGILVLVGVYLYKKNIYDPHTISNVSYITMDVVNPALIVSCVLSGDISATHKDLIKAVLVAFALYGFLSILGYLIPLVLPIEHSNRVFYNMMTVYTNVGFIGIPVARALLPNDAMLYVIICNVMYCLLFYTHGVTMLGGAKKKFHLKKIFNPGTIMSIFTLVLFWFDWNLPVILSDSIIYLGNATIFLSMSLLGASLVRTFSLTGLKDIRIWVYIVIRMLGVPILLTFILRIIGFDATMIQAFCLMAAMPAANLPLIQAEKIGLDTTILSEGIMVTTLLCFITIPLIMSTLF